MSQQQSGEKTEKATPKRKKDAREKGQVFKSTELIIAFSMIVMFGALSIFGGQMVSGIENLMRLFFNGGQNMPDVMDAAAVSSLFIKAAVQMAAVLLPLLAAAFLAGLVFNFLQVGFLFSGKGAKPDFSRINMFKGFKRIFSKNTLIDLFKSIIKITVLGVVAYNEYTSRMKEMTALMGEGVQNATRFTVDILFAVAFKLAIALAILAPFDYLYQWWKYQKDLKMTKQEVKDEYKLMEGNPQIKSRIRAKQRQMGAMRMMQAVKRADVIITNPTHYAIAVEYKEGENDAPVVVAKGKDYAAKKIREKAEEYKIQIVENRAVAQHLYFFCEIGDEVPEDMYQAVAEILAYVYKLKNKLRGGK
ncbi:MAG: flagellar biosynthesis protein FlhB [Christensenellales bacterium]